jgi:hypothetical protein
MAWPSKTTTQSVTFDKSAWTVADAKRWLREHGFDAPAVDETKTQYRFRQRDPNLCQKEHYATIKATPTINLVICRPRRSPRRNPARRRPKRPAASRQTKLGIPEQSFRLVHPPSPERPEPREDLPPPPDPRQAGLFDRPKRNPVRGRGGYGRRTPDWEVRQLEDDVQSLKRDIQDIRRLVRGGDPDAEYHLDETKKVLEEKQRELREARREYQWQKKDARKQAAARKRAVRRPGRGKTIYGSPVRNPRRPPEAEGSVVYEDGPRRTFGPRRNPIIPKRSIAEAADVFEEWAGQKGKALARGLKSGAVKAGKAAGRGLVKAGKGLGRGAAKVARGGARAARAGLQYAKFKTGERAAGTGPYEFESPWTVFKVYSDGSVDASGIEGTVEHILPQDFVYLCKLEPREGEPSKSRERRPRERERERERDERFPPPRGRRRRS